MLPEDLIAKMQQDVGGALKQPLQSTIEALRAIDGDLQVAGSASQGRGVISVMGDWVIPAHIADSLEKTIVALERFNIGQTLSIENCKQLARLPDILHEAMRLFFAVPFVKLNRSVFHPDTQTRLNEAAEQLNPFVMGIEPMVGVGSIPNLLGLVRVHALDQLKEYAGKEGIPTTGWRIWQVNGEIIKNHAAIIACYRAKSPQKGDAIRQALEKMGVDVFEPKAGRDIVMTNAYSLARNTSINPQLGPRRNQNRDNEPGISKSR